MKMPHIKTWKLLVLIPALLAGIYCDVHTESFLSFITLTAIFVFFVFLPLITIERVLAEKNRFIKILCTVTCIPITFLISGFVLGAHLDNEPFNFETSNVGPYPVWYVNPITHNCGYHLQKLVPSAVTYYRYWYSAGECSQSDKDRIFKEDYALFSTIDLRPNSPISIADQCLNLTHFLPYTYLHKEDVSDRRPAHGLLSDPFCYGLRTQTRWCKNRAVGDEVEKTKSVQEDNILLKRQFVESSRREVEGWGVSLQTFTSLCPNHEVFDSFMSVDISSDNAQQEHSYTVNDDSWSPDPRSLSEMIAVAQKDALSCRKFGGTIKGGGVGESEVSCISNVPNTLSYSMWPGSLYCGDMSTDTQYVVYNGNNDQWDFTIHCKNVTDCNGPENALCNKEGCKFSQKCLDSKSKS